MVNSKSNDDPRAVSDRLRLALSVLGCERYIDAAKMLGVSKQSIDSWLNARTLIPLEHAKKLKRRGFSLDWIYEGEPVRLATQPFKRGRPRVTEEEPRI